MIWVGRPESPEDFDEPRASTRRSNSQGWDATSWLVGCAVGAAATTGIVIFVFLVALALATPAVGPDRSGWSACVGWSDLRVAHRLRLALPRQRLRRRSGYVVRSLLAGSFVYGLSMPKTGFSVLVLALLIGASSAGFAAER